MGRLIHINGAPGVGKLTIARIMASHLGARVLDNHAIYNVGFAISDFGSPGFYNAVRAVRAVAYEQLLQLPDIETVILTEASFDDSDWGQESWRAVEQLAVARRWPLFSIALWCDAAEHQRRISEEGRAARGKLRDASQVNIFARRRLIENSGPLSLRLDITDRTADDAAHLLIDWIVSYIEN